MKKSIYPYVAATALALVCGGITIARNVESRVILQSANSIAARQLTPGAVTPVNSYGKAAPERFKTATSEKVARREAPVAVMEPDLMFYGIVGMSDHDPAASMNAHRGFYIITGEGKFTKLDSREVARSCMGGIGATFVADSCYVLEAPEVWNQYTYMNYSSPGWEPTGRIGNVTKDYSTNCSVYDRRAGSIIGYHDSGDDNHQLTRYNITLGKSEKYADLESQWSAMAIDASGTIYGLDINSDMYKVTRSGAVSKIGSRVIPVDMCTWEGSGALIDDTKGCMYVSAYGSNSDLTGYESGFASALYRIDLATMEATLVVHYTFNDNVMAMGWPSGTNKKAPAPASGLKVNFPEGSLAGKVSFTMPATSADGELLSGEATYSVYCDGVLASTGKASAGASVSVDIAARKTGDNYFYVEVSNTSGIGDGIGMWSFLGNDAPLAPASLTAQYLPGDVLQLDWDKVTGSVNGGYVNTDEITYNLRRYVGADDTEGESWADGISLCTDSRIMAEPDSIVDYTFGVRAEYDGKVSAETRSMILRAGYLVPPVNIGFDSRDEFSRLFTSLNFNSDNEDAPYYRQYPWKYTSEGWGASENGMATVGMSSDLKETEDMDKWLVSPNIRLQPGKVYQFSIDIKNGGSDGELEEFEVKLGTSGTDMSQMTTRIYGPWMASKSKFETFTGYITVEKEGKYYVGIHARTPKGRNTHRILYVDNFKIGLPQETSTPGAVSDLSVTPDASGKHAVHIEFRTPSHNLAGDAELLSLDRVDIYRNDEKVYSAEYPGFGTFCTYDDAPEECGDYTYRVVPVNENGEGTPSSATVYVGVKRPSYPPYVNLEETENPGEVTLTWGAPIVDVDGGVLPDDAILGYEVVRLYGSTQYKLFDVDADVTSVTFRPVGENDPQDACCFAVFASTEAGAGSGLQSKAMFVGKPDQLPWSESFTDGEFHHNYMIEGYGGMWMVFQEEEGAPLSADDDNGFSGMVATSVNDNLRLVSGRIDLTAAEHPYLSFQAYNLVPDDGGTNQNEVEMYVRLNDSDDTLLRKVVLCDDCKVAGWNRFKADLSEYAGKKIQLVASLTAINMQYTLIDDLKVYEAYAHDLTAEGISVPGRIKSNEEFKATVTIDNPGLSTEANYLVRVYRNGEQAAEARGRTVEAGASTWIDIPLAVSVLEDGTQAFHAEVMLDTDANTSDNVTPVVEAYLQHPTLPLVSGLEAICEEGSDVVTLTWERPVIERSPKQITEDFESYPGGTAFCGDWTIIDNDELPAKGFDNFTLPGAPVGRPAGWFMLDNSMEVFEPVLGFDAASGTKYLSAISVAGTADDWVISPRLTGNAQTVSFRIRSYITDVNESVQFLITGADSPGQIWNYTNVATLNIFSNEWTTYSFNIPQGVTYFAIRYASEYGLMVMLDDVKFTPLGHSRVLHQGYNIYRDGELLTPEPIELTKFSHAAGEKPTEGAVYRVTAVYDAGESRPVDAVVRITDNIADITGEDITIRTEGREIVVERAEGMEVTVTATDGKVMARRQASSVERIALDHPGIYLVQAGTKTVKVNL